MQKGCWKIDENDEACYIDIEEDDVPTEECDYSQWNELPDLLLEEVFSYLDVRERYYASLVCKRWYQAFHLPLVWRNFLVEDNTLTRTKFNYYSGWQHVLDHLRTQSCLTRVGPYIRGLEFRPTHSFHNLFQFMTLMSWCIEQSRKENCTREVRDIGHKINSLIYVFPCNMASADDPEGVKLFGTGGQLLAALKRLMSLLTKLKTLKLIDLMLERYEANHLLDEVLDSCCMELRVLYLVNVTTYHCPIMHIGLFLNLQILVISPQNVDDDVLQLLTDTKILHLHLLQNRYCPASITLSACSSRAWRALRDANPAINVHLRTESTEVNEVLHQPDAPVSSVTYKSTVTRISAEKILQLIDNYRTTLMVYGYELLPRYHTSTSFHNRTDSLLMLLVRQCPYLTTLAVREKISTATVLLIAHCGQNLRFFHVRRNAVILRCDWPKNPDWTPEFYKWLRRNCRSYEDTEREVSAILGYRWKMLSDKLYKKLEINERQSF